MNKTNGEQLRETPQGRQRKLMLSLANGCTFGDVLRELDVKLPVEDCCWCATAVYANQQQSSSMATKST